MSTLLSEGEVITHLYSQGELITALTKSALGAIVGENWTDIKSIKEDVTSMGDDSSLNSPGEGASHAVVETHQRILKEQQHEVLVVQEMDNETLDPNQKTPKNVRKTNQQQQDWQNSSNIAHFPLENLKTPKNQDHNEEEVQSALGSLSSVSQR